MTNIDVKSNPGMVSYYSKTKGENLSDGYVVVSSSADPNDETQRYKVLDSYDMYLYDSNTQSYTSFNAESAITTAVMYILNTDLPRVWFLSGHVNNTQGDIYQQMKDLLASQNYEVGDINLTTQSEDLQLGDVLVCVAPNIDLSPDEREIVKDFAETGGKILFCLDPLVEQELPNFDSILALYGVTQLDGIIVEGDSDHYTMNGPLYLVPSYSSHEIVSNLDLQTIVPQAGALQIPDVIADGTVTITPLLTTSNSAFLEMSSESIDMVMDDGAQTGRSRPPLPSKNLIQNTLKTECAWS